MSGFAPRVKAVLGPTNTGKTHLAIERLLGHASGIIGFPLRLLARENYDRMVAVKGARHVALITGEEKIVPPDARYFSCTVEAMPLDRKVEFLAVDEIQLCADPDRGHVFTDRLLHARGMVETMFLGAETIRKLLRRLVPEAEIETRPRLSRLTYAGPAKLSRLPPRSAIVAFSAAEVYAIAEAVRSRRGGCAVVMGRLSPRTRNAQVALYQDKEVDFLVATDAIGMGLNMDVDHVAFAGLSKFDGHRPRLLEAAEIAQIAGRAGRGMRDGTFGTTGRCPLLTDELISAVESHAFEPLEQLAWRNSTLDFASIDALLASLLAAPDRPGLVRGNDASDLLILAALAGDAAIRDRAGSPRAVRLLWEACQIPDFRKLATDNHTRLCARVFRHLLDDGALPEDWVAAQIGTLGRIDGDIDTLMQRLADVRIWAYIAARADWVRNALVWQGRAREAEDLLSDALHEKLMARFVDRRAAKLTRRLDEAETAGLLSAVTRAGDVVVEGHPVGRIDGFRFEPDATVGGADKRLVLRAARRALGGEMPRRVARLDAAPDTAFSLRADGTIVWQNAGIARLRQGSAVLAPAIEVIESEFLDGALRETVRMRFARFIEAKIAHDLMPLFAACRAAEAEPELRGVMHRLAEQAGILPTSPIDAALRPRLRRMGVRAGAFALYLPALLKPRPAALRATLWAAWRKRNLPALPAPGLVSVAAPDWPDGLAAFLGWLVCGTRAIRLDIAERIAGELRHAARRRPAPLPPSLASRLGVAQEDLTAVLRGLGFRVIPEEAPAEGVFGPPMPARIAIAPARRLAVKAPEAPPVPVNPDHPFAALAGFHRAAS
ncbi:DNA helicase [Acidiphilium sp. AL]|uniref:DNA helicase n=1 Tax=Acidiphilium iwatense TaxID=768198 RepID=A0ABS9DVT6_9PROT|nr:MULTISPECIES: helicase-related protein [Acidiphilium]MCF3946846.1 DNA helicase [Acidiphilium iwatense]MCU4161031.1 DNA helicase [Acidiphilium sp. AL]